MDFGKIRLVMILNATRRIRVLSNLRSSRLLSSANAAEDKILYYNNINKYDCFQVESILKHPLIIKHKFDHTDFVLGAKEAYSKLYESLNSIEFNQYCNKYVTNSIISKIYHN